MKLEFNSIQEMKDFLAGLTEGRKEKCLEQNKDGTIRPCEVMKENEELKAQVEKMKICSNCKWKSQYRVREHCIECGKVKNKG